MVELDIYKYEIVKNIDECFKLEEVTELFTDYFYPYDYIFGDYSYDKLRLKGFCTKHNSKFNEINDITSLNNYIENFCSYNGKYFLLKKINK